MRFSPEDTERIQSELALMSARSMRPYSLGSLLNRWRTLVHQVVGGAYADNIYEYEYDIAARTLLDEIERSLTPSGKVTLAGELEPLDAAFRSATFAVAGDGSSWWQNRYPTRCGTELSQDLAARGLTPS